MMKLSSSFAVQMQQTLCCNNAITNENKLPVNIISLILIFVVCYPL